MKYLLLSVFFLVFTGCAAQNAKQPAEPTKAWNGMDCDASVRGVTQADYVACLKWHNGHLKDGGELEARHRETTKATKAKEDRGHEANDPSSPPQEQKSRKRVDRPRAKATKVKDEELEERTAKRPSPPPPLPPPASTYFSPPPVPVMRQVCNVQKGLMLRVENVTDYLVEVRGPLCVGNGVVPRMVIRHGRRGPEPALVVPPRAISYFVFRSPDGIGHGIQVDFDVYLDLGPEVPATAIGYRSWRYQNVPRSDQGGDENYMEIREGNIKRL